MFRPDDPSAVASRPATTALGTEGWYLRGVAGGAQGTVLSAEQMNMLIAELEGVRALNPVDPGSDKADDGQLAAAIEAYTQANSPGGHIYGLTHAKTSAYEITSDAGECRNGANTALKKGIGGQAKRLDLTWAQGSAGGLASAASLADDTWYPYFVGWDAANITFGWDLLANRKTAAGLAADSGYTNWRRIGYHRTGNSGYAEILNYWQDPEAPERIMWDEEEVTSEIFGSIDTTAEQTHAIRYTPLGCTAQLSVGVRVNTGVVSTGEYHFRVYPTEMLEAFDIYRAAVSFTKDTDDRIFQSVLEVPVGASGNLHTQASTAGTGAEIQFSINPLSYIDTRGRFAA